MESVIETKTNVFFLPSAYHELDFTVEDRNTIYWHHTVPKYLKIKLLNNVFEVFENQTKNVFDQSGSQVRG